MIKKINVEQLILITEIGCTNQYINSSYMNDILGDKHLLFYPVPISNIEIEDSTIVDFIMEDFSVTKENSILACTCVKKIVWYVHL